jgi:hypothetical protein
MMDWQSGDDDRNADPGWQADWQRGHEIGWLIVVGLAFLMAVVSVLLGGWETPVVAALYPECRCPIEKSRFLPDRNVTSDRA